MKKHFLCACVVAALTSACALQGGTIGSSPHVWGRLNIHVFDDHGEDVAGAAVVAAGAGQGVTNASGDAVFEVTWLFKKVKLDADGRQYFYLDVIASKPGYEGQSSVVMVRPAQQTDGQLWLLKKRVD